MSLSRLYHCFLIVIYCCLPLTGAAQESERDSLPSHSLVYVREADTYLRYFSRLSGTDITSNLDEFHHSFSQIKAGYQHDNTSLPLDAQQGSGAELMFFRAQSHMKTSKNAVAWGEACYENGRRMGISWNLNSDYKRIFPYVIADTTTLSMLREYYLFRGGYAHQLNKLALGAELSYRSTTEYRDVDPRPKNTSLDVQIRLGAGYAVSVQRMVGLTAGAGRYNQQSNVLFMNPQGNRVLYHLMGLGMQYFRFKGLQNAVKYEGSNYLIGLSTYTKNRMGLQASADMAYETVQKRLASERDVPICDAFQTTWRGDVSWIGQRKQWTYKVTLNVEAVERDGQERFYDSGLTNYQQIASARPFVFQRQMMCLSVTALRCFSALTWLIIQPNVAYEVQNTQYIMPVRQLKTAFMIPSLQMKVSRMFSKSLLSVGLQTAVGRQMHHHFVFDEPELFDKPVEMFRNNAAMQQANYCDAALEVRYDVQLIKALSSVFVQITAGHRWFDNHQKAYNTELSVGVTL